ncbi:hypothetical protein SAMD00019534_000230 [Acytostelium subglobosum LB1]|uniref:hypothetical protein n=1 Tax=Acytostelium subglobosum LB1 TaxID=1410327 RepID=UPI000644CB87|nr:hypothetical protein SAMD00019534_000230 [Acytostelium subglobosum LB1]GAM16848.1 hypothetical protein SAMD00019534_000230 [Acytostelium subglobosum LB1]|eukprot:XP_012758910.1 hypothetical protein SAMD00019534_000230 [Acytostelium subglobosum LB1]
MAFNLLSSFLVEDLPPQSDKMICVHNTDTLPKVFETLSKNNILSAPVLNEFNRPEGLVDFVDIVCCVVQILHHTDLLGNDYYSFLEREDLFSHTYASFLSDLSNKNPFIPVVKGASLLEAITVMSKNKLHRVPIIANDMSGGHGPKIINLVTQSAILQYLSKNIDKLGNWSNKSLKDLGFEEKHVITINYHKRALEAFQLMAEHRVNGIAVVDEKNQILANISARDLKELLNETRIFENLFLSVGEFISKVRQQDYKAVHPSICCSKDEPLKKLITRMAAAKIHRVFMVDQDRKPIGVVSLQDILEKILDHINSGTGGN